MNSNILNLNILGKDNIVCVSLVNAIMCLNSIGEPNVPNELYLSFTLLNIIYIYKALLSVCFFFLSLFTCSFIALCGFTGFCALWRLALTEKEITEEKCGENLFMSLNVKTSVLF